MPRSPAHPPPRRRARAGSSRSVRVRESRRPAPPTCAPLYFFRHSRKRRPTDPILPQDIRHGHAGLALSQNGHDWRFRKLRRLHRTLRDGRPQSLTRDCLVRGEAYASRSVSDLSSGVSLIQRSPLYAYWTPNRVATSSAIACTGCKVHGLLVGTGTTVSTKCPFAIRKWAAAFASASAASGINLHCDSWMLVNCSTPQFGDACPEVPSGPTMKPPCLLVAYARVARSTRNTVFMRSAHSFR